MTDIRKMIWFDFCTIKSLTVNFVIIITVAAALLAIVVNPGLSIIAYFGAAALFLPVQMIAGRGTFNPLYGILPIQRKSITRAGFIENGLTCIAAELFVLLLKTVSDKLQFFMLLRNALNKVDQPAPQPSGMEVCIAFFCVTLLFLCYFRMTSDIFGQENEMKIFLITMFVLFVMFIIFYQLLDRQIIDADFINQRIPQTGGGKFLLAVLVHLLVFGICTLFCEITVKKLAKREL